MLCPPRMEQPASRIFSAPPLRICSRSPGSPLGGYARMESEEIGRPPIAYTSLNALAAASPPYVKGSSTMGVKKSTVCTRASSAVSWYTPASSAVSNPTSTFSSGQRGTVAKTRSNNFGLSLLAQPAAFTCAVNFLCWVVSSIRDPYYNSGDATHCHFFRCLAFGIGVDADFPRTYNRTAPQKGRAL